MPHKIFDLTLRTFSVQKKGIVETVEEALELPDGLKISSLSFSVSFWQNSIILSNRGPYPPPLSLKFFKASIILRSQNINNSPEPTFGTNGSYS